MALREKKTEVEGRPVILREPCAEAFIPLEHTWLRVLHGGVLRFLQDGIELPKTDSKGVPLKTSSGEPEMRRLTLADLTELSSVRPDDPTSAGVFAAIAVEVVRSLARASVEEYRFLYLGSLSRCRIDGVDMPEDLDEIGKFLDNHVEITRSGLKYIVALQFWYWVLPTLPGGLTVGRSPAGSGGAKAPRS